MMLFSPLEQFDILPIVPFFFKTLDISITNETIILILGIFVLFCLSILTH